MTFKLIFQERFIARELNNLIKLITHVFFPLAVGSFIYICLRCSNVFFIEIIENMYCFSHNENDYLEKIFADWVKYNLPDGLWVYSSTSLMIIIWKNLTWQSLGWICSGLLIAIISEFGQAIGIFPGTYDPVDIVFYLLAFGLAYLNLSPITLKNTSRSHL